MGSKRIDIHRDLNTVNDTYDLAIVGGGVYGICLLLEASRRGLKAVMIEQKDFAHATSGSSQGIIHGGLRYLQSMDFKRVCESIEERRWFLRHFGDLVEPLACLMPLYGRLIHRPATMRVVCLANDWLSRHRNDGVDPNGHIGPSVILDAQQSAKWFPLIRDRGLKGSLCWTDGIMTQPQRLVMELLRWGVSSGGVALNYVRATGLLGSHQLEGVAAIDVLTGDALEVRASRVINASGPWSSDLARSWGAASDGLCRPSLAFTLMTNRPAISRAAVAVSVPGSGSKNYFIVPWRDHLFVGTSHAPWPYDGKVAAASEDQIDAVIADLNAAVPGLALNRSHVVRVYAGLIPATQEGGGQPSCHPAWVDHEANGGPRGLWSVSGVKWTTARRVAYQTLERMWRSTRGLPEYQALSVRPDSRVYPGLDFMKIDPEALEKEEGLCSSVLDLCRNESVMTAEDLILRRTDWGADQKTADRLTSILTPMLAGKAPAPYVSRRF